MAYPTVSSPYGLQAINRVDGMPYAGQVRHIPIAADYATAIFFGDTVRIGTDGYLAKDDSTTTVTGNGMVGVLVGCAYTNSANQPVEGQYYPAGASTASNLAYGYVIDDPMAAFKVAVVSTDTTITTTGVSRAVVGKNIQLVQNAGSTTTGDSKIAVLASGTDTAATTPMRVIDVVPATAIGADAYVELIVKINVHQYLNTTGE